MAIEKHLTFLFWFIPWSGIFAWSLILNPMTVFCLLIYYTLFWSKLLRSPVPSKLVDCNAINVLCEGTLYMPHFCIAVAFTKTPFPFIGRAMIRQNSTFICWIQPLQQQKGQYVAFSRTTNEMMEWKYQRFCDHTWVANPSCLSWPRKQKGRNQSLDYILLITMINSHEDWKGSSKGI